MLNKSVLIGVAMLAASAGSASAATYHIAITGACDMLTLTNTSGVVVGQSTVANCDTGNEVGTQANITTGGNIGKKELVVGSDFGLAPDSWTWYFNLKTKTATLTGTTDGSSVLGPLNFAFTYTHPGAKPSGTKSATSIVKGQ